MAFYRRKLPHLQRDNQRHFVTVCTLQGWILPQAARAIVLECCRYDNDVRHFLHAVVVMPDHAHVIFTVLINSQKAEFYSLAEVMGRIEGASAQLINRELDRQGRVWQTESFDPVFRCSESVDAKIVYILENPVRAGLVPERTEYQWTWVRRDSANSAGLRPDGTARGTVST